VGKKQLYKMRFLCDCGGATARTKTKNAPPQLHKKLHFVASVAWCAAAPTQTATTKGGGVPATKAVNAFLPRRHAPYSNNPQKNFSPAVDIRTILWYTLIGTTEQQL
jgi:hypothetical protein